MCSTFHYNSKETQFVFVHRDIFAIALSMERRLFLLEIFLVTSRLLYNLAHLLGHAQNPQRLCATRWTASAQLENISKICLVQRNAGNEGFQQHTRMKAVATKTHFARFGSLILDS